MIMIFTPDRTLMHILWAPSLSDPSLFKCSNITYDYSYKVFYQALISSKTIQHQSHLPCFAPKARCHWRILSCTPGLSGFVPRWRYNGHSWRVDTTCTLAAVNDVIKMRFQTSLSNYIWGPTFHPGRFFLNFHVCTEFGIKISKSVFLEFFLLGASPLLKIHSGVNFFSPLPVPCHLPWPPPTRCTWLWTASGYATHWTSRSWLYPSDVLNFRQVLETSSGGTRSLPLPISGNRVECSSTTVFCETIAHTRLRLSAWPEPPLRELSPRMWICHAFQCRPSLEARSALELESQGPFGIQSPDFGPF